MLLAIDTSTHACSVAIAFKDTVEQEFSDEPRSHTRLLLPMVDQVLAAAGCELSQLDAIAYGAGPGSFTGLRIGMGVVQGLAFGANVPVIPVSTLQVMAQGAVRKFNLRGGETLLPALDARMEEIYWGVYRAKAGGAEEVVPDALTAPEKVAAELQGSGIDVGVGEGWQYADQFPVKAVRTDSGLVPEARDVAVVAQSLLQSGKAVPVEQARLRYLRDKVSWKKHQKLRKQE